MADKKPTATNKKRVVKNPETFRERAIKATEASDKPSRSSKVKAGAGKPIRGTGKVLRKIFNRQPFLFIAKILRFVGRFVLPRYLRNSFKELRQVTWPNWKQSRQLTYAVLAFAIVFGGTVALVDLGLDKVFKNILLK